MKQAWAFALLILAPLSAHAAEKPNIIVILVDDMGYGDIAAHGNPVIRTPHLDKLHAESARLTDFHVDPTCSPTRAALLTGKYAHRVKVWHTIAAGNHLREGETTLADILRANGYRTGMFGKWHLGSNLPYRPIDRGFDEWLGQGDGGTGTTADHFLNDRVDDHYLHNGTWKKIEGWAPEIFFKATLDFARESRKQDKPFFAYLATYLPHTPLTLPDPAWVGDDKGKFDPNIAYFLTAVERIDAMIGRLRGALDAGGMARDTILIFLTDNGGTFGINLFNAGMRGGKGEVTDGGHRVPCLIHWPGGKLRHGEDIPALNAHIDVLPTLAELCGLKLPDDPDFDGRSFAPQLRDPAAAVPDRTLFVEFQRNFKPVKWQNTAGMTSRWRLLNDKELYDIKADPEQKHNLIAGHPEIAAAIRGEYETYWKRVTPGDRDRVEFLVGDDREPETFLHPSDWYLPEPPWHHARVAGAQPDNGDWRIRAARSGTYHFEVRRWPREADAPIAGIPTIRKTVDAWDPGGPKPDLIYGGRNTVFKALPVASVRLAVGEKTQTLPVAADATEVGFRFDLEESGSYRVHAEFLDARGAVICGGYYTYCRRVID